MATRINLALRCIFVGALIILAAAPVWASANQMRILGEALVLCSLAILWNLLAGYGGRVSVGQQAYVGIGGYALLALGLSTSLPPFALVPLVGLAGAAISFPIGALVFRLRGHYFAIGTWAVAEILRLSCMQVEWLGGGSGTSLPASVLRAISPDRGSRLALIYLTGVVLFLLVLAASLLLMRSRYGLALRAMRDNELAAESVGVGLRPLRLGLYCGIAGLTAMIGSLILMQKLRISPDAAFSVQDWTAFVLFIVVIGGVGTLEGPIIGTVLFMMLRQTLADFGPLYLILLGSLAVAVMLLAPNGVWGWLAARYGLSFLPDRHNPPKTTR